MLSVSFWPQAVIADNRGNSSSGDPAILHNPFQPTEPNVHLPVLPAVPLRIRL